MSIEKIFATSLFLLMATFQAWGANLSLPIGGKVSVELISSDAAFSDSLSLVSPAAAVAFTGCKVDGTAFAGLKLMSEKASQHGCRVELDADPGTAGIQAFPAGSLLQFNLCAQTDANPATCEHVWSSNTASNSDGVDHVRITPIRSAEFPNRIFQLSWEDLPGGGDNDFNDLIAVVRVELDSDGDGLWDDWEQFGVDTDGNGTIDLNLPALGANSQHKDIFLEIDFMDCALAGGDCAAGDTHSHRPKAAAIAAAVQAFANAPVPNPDGVNGINLHIDISNSIAHQNALNINGLCVSGGPGIGSFDAIKNNAANFGPNNPRRFAYRYSLFTHQQLLTTTSSGCGELPGNDFQVALGGWNIGQGDLDGDGLVDADVGTVQQQAGTLMHEFGHNLILRHGGGDNNNFKPNYLSIMSYHFQMVGILPSNRVDYSRAGLPTLNESNLNEPVGIGDGTDNTRHFCPNGTLRTGVGNAAIDWNCNNSTLDASVAVNTNAQGGLEALVGFDDWTNIKYDFQNAGDFEDGEHAFSERVAEIDYPTSMQIAPPTGPSCLGVAATIVGTSGSDAINGTAGDDVIVGMGGNDVINGGAGNDLICTGAGNDAINGGAGNDNIDAGDGNNQVNGGTGDDTLTSGNGDDSINGGGGNDAISSGAGNDVINAGTGNDRVDAGPGVDTIQGGAGTDVCINGETINSCP